MSTTYFVTKAMVIYRQVPYKSNGKLKNFNNYVINAPSFYANNYVSVALDVDTHINNCS